MAAGSARQLLDAVAALERVVDDLDRVETENRILMAERQRMEALVTQLEQECDRLADALRAAERGED